MSLSKDLISQFVKATKDTTTVKKESTVYGTVVKYNEKTYVKIDGSDLLTPAETLSSVEEGERVSIMIKDHTATITGNYTAPSASSIKVDGMDADLKANTADIKNLVAKNAEIENLVASKATIEDLRAANAEIDTLKADYAEIETLVADKASIGDLAAVNADIKSLKADKADIAHLEANYATIGSLNAVYADVTRLEADKANIKDLEANYATIESLEANYATINQLESNYATIKQLDAANANITNLQTETANINTALIDKANVSDLAAANAVINDLKAGKADIGDLSAANAKIADLEAGKADISILEANYATIKQLDATNANVTNLQTETANINKALIDKADVSDLNATNANITNLQATKANVSDLNVTNANVNTLTGNLADITTLVNGNLTSDNIQSMVITGDKFTVADAFIKDAMIDSVSANKINAGVINTNNVKIQSNDGSMLLQGNLQQFKDKNGKVRIQIGKDATGNFTFVLYDENGTGQLINQNGIQSSNAIADGLIVDAKVADNANIAGSKLDIDSVVTEVNNGTTSIKGTKIYLDDQKQSLNVAFNNMSTTVSGNTNTIESHTTSINTMNGKVTQLISDTTITKDNGTTVSLKDAYNATVDTVDSHSTKIGSLETNLATANNNISSVSSKQSALEQNLNGFKQTVSQTYATKTSVTDVSNNLKNNYSTTTAMNSAINQKANEITSTVSETYATKTSVTDVSNNLKNNYSTTSAMNSAINQKANEITSTVSETYATKTALSTVDGKFADYSTTSAMNTAINQKANEITSSVSQTYATKTSLKATDDKFANYSTTSQMNSAINQKSDSILSTVSNTYTTKADFNNLSIGGTNLIANSAPKSTSGWQQHAGSSGSWILSLVDCSSSTYGKAIRATSNNAAGGGLHKQPVDYTKLVKNEYYTLSAWIRASKNCTVNFMNEYMEHGNCINITTEWKYYSYTDKLTGNGNHSDIIYVTNGIENGMWIEVHSLKLEKGTKSSSWSPAPQDIDYSITAVDNKFVNYSTTSQMNSAINQKANEITSTVSETYATKTALNTVDGKFANYSTTSAMNSAINQKANEITSTVSETYATKTSLKATDDKFANYSTTSAMNSAINQKADSILSTVSKTYATQTSLTDVSNNLKNNYSTTSAMNSAINQKANEITSTVSKTYATKTSVTDVSNNLKNNYSTTSAMNSAINQKANEITSSVSQTYATKADFNNLNIGGTNLLRNSTFNYDLNKWWNGAGVNYNPIVNEGVDGGKCVKFIGKLNTTYHVAQDMYNLKPNTEYTFTAYYKTKDIVKGTTNPYFNFNLSYNQDSTYKSEISLVGNIQLNTNGWVKVTKTFTTRTTNDWNLATLRLFCRDCTGTIWYDHMKLEEGNKATDWSPAPEDADNAIATVDAKFVNYSTTSQMNSAINQKANEITSTVSETYATKSALNTVDGKFANYSTTSQMNSAINQKSDSILSTVSGTYATKTALNTVDGKFANYSTTSAMNSAINQKSDSILSTVSNTYTTKADYNNLNIGGTNLVTNSCFAGGSTTGWGTNQSSTCSVTVINETSSPTGKALKLAVTSTDPGRGVYNFITPKSIGEYTLSFYGKSDTAGYKIHMTWEQCKVKDIELTTSWQKYTLTMNKTNLNRNAIAVYTRLNSANGNFYVHSFKLEKGNKATSWSPAPEDVNASISAVDGKFVNYSTTSQMNSAINQKANEITSTVSETYATKTALNTVDGKFANYSTTSQMNSAINQKSDSILSTVSGTYATKTALNTVDGKFANYSTTSAMNSAINQKADGILSTVSNTYTTKADFNGLTIGGTNLLLGSKREYTNNDYCVAQYYPSSPLVQGEQYTISLCVTPAKGVTRYNAFLSQGYRNNADLYVNGTSKQIITKTFTAYYYDGRDPSANYANAAIHIFRIPNDGSVTTNSTIHWIKIEKGNKATSWSPAPEDIDASITAVDNKFTNYSTTSQMNSAINQKANEITSTVSETYATKTALNTVDGKFANYSTTSAMNSAINQKSDAILSTVSGTYATKTALNTVDGKFANYSTTTAMNTAINQKAESITQSVSETYATKTSLKSANDNITSLTNRMKSAESKLTKDSLTTTIGSYYTTSTDVNNLVTAKGYATTSEVSQTANSLTAMFRESGGYNLLYNGNFRRGFDQWTVSGAGWMYEPNQYAKAGYDINVTGALSTTKYAVQNINITEQNVDKYVASCWMYTTSSGSDGTTNPFKQLYVEVYYTDDTISYYSNGNSVYDSWQQVSIYITRPSDKYIKRINVYGFVRDTTKRVYFSAMQVEKGTQPTTYTPNPNEVYDGITQIDKDGIKVKHTSIDSNSYTHMSPTGFYLKNKGTDIFKVDANGLYVKGNGDFTGKVTANDGSIGGFNINSGKLVGTGGNGVGMSGNGTDWAFWAGSNTGGNAPFHVGHEGNLYATQAYITGTITGSTINAGTINGATINSDSFIGDMLAIDGTISAKSLQVQDIDNAKYPGAVTADFKLYVSTSGNDDSEIENGATFATFDGLLDKLPRNLNGHEVRIEMSTNITENVDFKGFFGGKIRLYMKGHTLYGYVVSRMGSARINICSGYIGNASDTSNGWGKIHPSKGYAVSSYTTTVASVDQGAIGLYNIDVYGADNYLSGSTTKLGVAGQDWGTAYLNGVSYYGCDIGARANAGGRIHDVLSYNVCKKYGFYATTGGYITLAGSEHSGGKSKNYHEADAGKVIVASGATFASGEASVPGGSAPVVPTTKTITIKSTYGDTYRSSVYNNWKKDGTVRQGDYGYGDCNGCWFFGDAFSDVEGKTISKVTIKITRQSGGSSSAVGLVVKSHGYSGRPSGKPSYRTTAGTLSLATGASGTLTITNSTILNEIKSGAVKGFGIQTTYDSSHYAVCSGSVTVKITYTE